ncbi:hypothetical protein [Candidatus Odyssella thessalonicensis]|uniref:hypothetical protein n=1 Tax=Candidatus Odyssella thessalonicensis TaxID=84647 RepID=UPI000225B1AF|nr:hypothetical protein [Candidatus Odyssella thessalonicensis]
MNLKNFPLSLALCLSVSLCFAMDDPSQDERAPYSQTKDYEICDLYQQADREPRFERRALLFIRVIEAIGEILPPSLSPTKYTRWHQECLVLKAKSLEQVAVALHNQAAQPGSAPDLALLNQSLSYLLNAESFYKSHDLPDFYQHSQRLVAAMRESLGVVGLTQAPTQLQFGERTGADDLYSILDASFTLFTDSLDHLEKSIAAEPSEKKKEAVFAGKAIYLLKIIESYSFFDTELTNLYNQPAKNLKHYQKLGKILPLIDKLVSLFDQHYITSSPINFQLYLPAITQTKVKRALRNRQAPARNSQARSPDLSKLNPHDFQALLYALYCGLLKEAHITSESIAQTKQSEKKRGPHLQHAQQYLSKAITLYKDHFYQQEYADNPEVEEAFIIACLEDLRGVGDSLSVFYARLRQEKQQRRAVETAATKAPELGSSLTDKGKEKEEPTVSPQEVDLAPQPPLPPSAAVSAQPATDSVIPSNFRPLMPVRQANKSKRNRIRRSAELQPTSPLSAPQSSVATRKMKGTNLPKQENKRVRLSLEDYNIFAALVGKVVNRSISLNAVKKLLVSLGCTIAEGKGSHQKATARNGQMWIIPQAWDGPIPHCYRHQLNKFLQDKLSINPDKVCMTKHG